jgi:lysophospholipase L1-like esterase
MDLRIAKAAGLLLAALVLSLLPGASAQSRTSKKTTKKARSTAVKKPAWTSTPSPSRIDDYLSLARQTPIENVAALVPFFERLYRHQQGQASENLHILHFGDSHTAADEWTGFLRALFQHRFGDGGSGYSYAGKPWNSYRRLDLRSSASRGWYSDGLAGRQGDGLYGLGGVSISTTRPGESVSLEASCDSLELLYLQQPGGGELIFHDNGAAVERIITDGVLSPGYFRYPCSPGPHRFLIQTAERRPVRLFGWVAEQGRGITYETLGINGAQAAIVFRWEENLHAALLAKRDPALIVLAYGTNEAGDKDWTLENYRAMFASLIHRFRKASPSASILVIGPPDRFTRVRGRGWQPFDNVDRIIQAQRDAALGTGCAFLDLRAKMGGKGSMRGWVQSGLAQADYVHFTAPGYRVLGGALFQDLMQHYGAFLKIREQLMGQEKNGQTIENH